LGITQGWAVVGFPQLLLDLGDTDLLPIGQFRGVPLVFAIFLVVFAVLWVIVHKTPYGLKLQWHGSNSKVSFFAGIDNKRVMLKTFVISGVVASVAGLVTMARTNSARADYGGSLLFQALLVCVLSGISPIGGKGKFYNIIFAMIALQIISSGFNMMRISPLIRDSIFGFLLVAAIIIELAQAKAQANRLNRGAILHKASEGE